MNPLGESRYIIPVDYHFNKTSVDMLENIKLIFTLLDKHNCIKKLKNYDSKFMRYIDKIDKSNKSGNVKVANIIYQIRPNMDFYKKLIMDHNLEFMHTQDIFEHLIQL